MAIKYAVKTGNWSDSTVWNGGTLPTSADDAYSNTFTVTIDQNVTVLSIQNTTTTGVTAGGGFAISGAYTINVTGTGIVAGSTATAALTCNNITGVTVTVNGNITAGSVSGAHGLLTNNTGTININGNIYGGSPALTNYGLYVVTNATLNIVGFHNGSATSAIVIASSGANVTHTGSLVSTANTIVVNSGTFTFIGDCTSYLNVPAIVLNGGTTTFTGTLRASFYQVGTGISIANNGTVLNFSGTLIPGVNAAIVSSGTPTIIMSGKLYFGDTGMPPFSGNGYYKLSPSNSTEMRFITSNFGTSSLWSSDYNGGQPAISNVRSGVTYGIGNSLTGTVIVPAASSVVYGCPVDNTTGTAVLKPADLAGLIGAQLTAYVNSVP